VTTVAEAATAEDARQTVLVVDDEVLIRMVISEYLRGCGYRVIEAASADEALTVLQHLETKVDVVFSDIDMPGSMDGFALSHWLRANRPSIDVILAGSITRAADEAAELCDAGPLPKPYEPQLVIDRIRRLLAARAASRKS
jgi:CheY-like chemotaxis protein